MNVSCTSCSAKYAIPDDKVRGKKVKITCKHCGTGIIVDGTKLDAPGEGAAAPVAAPAAVAPAPVAAPATPTAPSEPSFDIAHPDDRQETLPLGELADKYLAGTLTDEAFVWREGMPDWKAPLDIPEIRAAVEARGGKKRVSSSAAAEEEETKLQLPSQGFPDEAAGKWREPAKEAPSHPAAAFDLRSPSAVPLEKPEAARAARASRPDISPPAASAAPAPSPAEPAAVKPAARRSAARGGADLFGDLAAAGSEDDETLGTDAKEVPRLTGQRNESSVLFSLDSLTKPSPPAPKKAAPKQDDAAFLMGLDSAPSSLANVGGSFGSALAAPDFNAPVAPLSEARAADPAGGSLHEKKKGGSGVWIALVAVLVLGGGAAAMVMSGKLASTPAPSPSAAAPPVETAAAPTTPAPTAVATAPATADSAAPAADAAPAVASGGAASTPAVAAPGVGATPTPTPATAPATKPTEPSKGVDKPAEKPADKPAEASGAPPFDTAAAKTALGSAAANAGSCKTPDGPTGSGKVSVTFMPSGRATNTQVSGDLAGTAVGGCVARLFRSAKVPAFSGEAVTVTKSFAVQ